MQVYDVRNRQPDHHADPYLRQIQVLDDGAVSPYGVACVHEARTVVELALNGQHTLLCCAECGALLGVTQHPVA